MSRRFCLFLTFAFWALLCGACFAQNPPGITNPSTLLGYLAKLRGNGMVSGQYTANSNTGGSCGGLSPLATIQAESGQWLGMVGCDMWDYPDAPNAFDNSCSNYAIPYWQAGGLVMVTWAMPNPATNVSQYDVSVNPAPALYTTGNATNTQFLVYLNEIATALQAYKTAGVTVILKPFSQSNMNWYWWATNSSAQSGAGSGITSAQFIAMWQYVWNYLTVTKGLNNLVWMFAPNTTGTGTGDTTNFPGAAYVDMTGLEVYSDTPGSCCTADYAAVSALNLPIGMSLYGTGTPTAGDAAFDMRIFVSQMQTYMPNVVLWQQQWSDVTLGNVGRGMDTLTNTADLTAALANPYVVNRGEITYGNSAYTWNPGDKSATVLLTGGNLLATSTAAAYGSVRANFAYSSGSYCFESTVSYPSAYWLLGLANSTFPLASIGLGADGNSFGFGCCGGLPQQLYFNNAVQLTTAGASSAAGDKVTECVNLTTDQVWVTDNAMRAAGFSWNNSLTANPATATGGISLSGLECPCYPAFNTRDAASAATLNLAGPFAVSTPAGFNPWQPSAIASTHRPQLFILGDKDNRFPSWYIPAGYSGVDDGR